MKNRTTWHDHWRNFLALNGDIEIRDCNTIEGDIIHKPNRAWHGGFLSWNIEFSVLTIDSSSIMRGDIYLYWEVNLITDEDAVVGLFYRTLLI